MTFRAHITTPSRRTTVALGSWIAAVPVVAGLALLAGSGVGAEAGAAVITGTTEPRLAARPASDAVVVEVTTTTATTAPPTTLPPTTVPPPPPTTAAPEPVAEPAPAPAPRPAPAVVEAPPAPPVTEAPAPPPAAAAPAGVDAAAEQQLLDDHNRRRAAQGLPPLQRHGCLDAIARNWSAGMASSQQLRHNPGYGGAIDGCFYWTAAGENVGFSPSVSELAERFWGSPEHRANIVGGYQYVGIGVVVDGNGVRWATLEFASA